MKKYIVHSKLEVPEGAVAVVKFKEGSHCLSGASVRYNVGPDVKDVEIDEEVSKTFNCTSQYDFWFHMWGFEYSFIEIIVYSKED